MTLIDPSGSGSITDRNSPTIQATLSRLGRALTIRGASGEAAAQRGDSVQISPAAALASASTTIADLGVLLADLETLVSQAAQDNAGADVRAEAQRRIDEAVVLISETAQNSAQSRGIVGAGEPRPANVFQIADGIVDVVIHQNNLPPRTRFDVEITIEEPAERAGMLLSFGGVAIDAGTLSSFVFEISGVDGTQQLSFASGTSLADVSAAINTFTNVTGVRAAQSGTAIRIEGTGFGVSEFVSVKIVDDGEVNGQILDLKSLSDGSPAADLSQGVTNFNSVTAANGLLDKGKDFVVDSSSLFVQTDGARIRGQAFADLVDFSFRVESDSFGALPPGAQLGTPFFFFTIVGRESLKVDGPPIDAIPLGNSSPVTQALSPFTTAGASSGDFVAALDAIRSLREHADGGITNESLAKLRKDLITQAGAALGITPASDAQQALDLLGGATT